MSLSEALAPPRSGALPALAVIGAGVAAAALALPLSPTGAALAAAVYAAAAAAVCAGVSRHGHDRFGAANVVTLARAGGVAVFAGLVAAPDLIAGPAGWWAAAAAAGLLALDGVDGWAARRQGLASGFGARFDMETDALFILVLCGLALALGKAGPWVLALGAARYVFVLAGVLWPRLARPLPPSMRRKAVCVLQVAALTALLAPAAIPPVSGILAGFALAALVWSFAVDLRWLIGAPS